MNDQRLVLLHSEARMEEDKTVSEMAAAVYTLSLDHQATARLVGKIAMERRRRVVWMQHWNRGKIFNNYNTYVRATPVGHRAVLEVLFEGEWHPWDKSCVPEEWR